MTLKDLRWKSGMTQKQAADFLGVSLRAYQTYEKSEDKAETEKYKSFCARLASIRREEQSSGFHVNVVLGDGLSAMTEHVKPWDKRTVYPSLKKYLDGDDSGRVCVLYGLRRTGKTTLLLQAIDDLPKEESVYIKIRVTDRMADLLQDLKRLQSLGYRYVFIDEVTLMEDFIDSASALSDIYAMMGMKIVLSGTDSLGFWISLSDELYDRAYLLHTTFIPYAEYARLLGKEDVDEYIRYGGTLRMGDNDFDDDDAQAPDASFRNDESTRRYIDTAICRNIQRSLECYKNGTHFMALQDLYRANELTGAINRVIERANHEFLLKVLTENFKSHDLGSAKQLLSKQQNFILETIDIDDVTRRLMRLLEIKNQEEQSVLLNEEHLRQIETYLKALGLVENCEVRYEMGKSRDYPIFTQPGMRYCQALALTHSLLKDEEFLSHTPAQQDVVIQKISEDVMGRMLEDIVLLETRKALSKQRYEVFKFIFTVGEYDMVVFDKESNDCSVFEVKHSGELSPAQKRHLQDPEKQGVIEARIAPIAHKIVLYRGEDKTDASGIEYKNVENYLKGL